MLTKRQRRFLQIARETSLESTVRRVRIGSIIVIGNKIIATGMNQTKSHPDQAKLNVLRFDDDGKCKHFLHAEMNSLLKCQHMDLTRAKMYIYRESKDGTIRMCRPCNACMQKIKECGIREIFYTTNDGYAHEYIK